MENVSFSDTKVQDDQKIIIFSKYWWINTVLHIKKSQKKACFTPSMEQMGPAHYYSMQKACVIFKNKVFIKQ